MSNKLKKYRINNKEMAAIFGYSSANSFSGSTRREALKKSVNKIILMVEDKIARDVHK